MLTLMCMTRSSISLLCVTILCVYSCGAETIATYSGQYADDLEQKQTLLQSISENIMKDDSEIKETIENIKAMENRRMSRLSSDRINIAEVMPPTEKINIAFIGMSGTLSPKSARDRFAPARDASRDQDF